ncbi:hypothetical protein MPSEU_000638500 [Mayamaea pseudoterrestris]|nr:hypothetical protein MPSEU_000638500 [Mayamaea pseudoterrestris]
MKYQIRPAISWCMHSNLALSHHGQHHDRLYNGCNHCLLIIKPFENAAYKQMHTSTCLLMNVAKDANEDLQQNLFDDSSKSIWDNDYSNDNDGRSHPSTELSKIEESEPDLQDEDSNQQREYDQWRTAVEKCLSDLQRRQASLEKEAKTIELVDSLIQRAQLLTTYMYMYAKPGIKSATVQDWDTGENVELKLDPEYDSAADEAAALFDRARKLKRGSQRVVALSEETTAAAEKMQGLQKDLGAAMALDGSIDEQLFRLVQDRLLKSSRTTGFQPPVDNGDEVKMQKSRQKERKPSVGTPSSNVRKLFTPAGSMILVGRNRRGNEYLSMTKARPNDVWMHARGTPGAHVLIPQSRGMPEPTTDCLQLAANLALFYSDARNERKAPVTVTLAKHVQKPRGAPLGAVKLRQEDRVIIGIADNVPDDLKEARERSGQIASLAENAYRAADKAKRRKQTLANASKSKKAKKK